MKSSVRNRAFTLIELLTVMAVIAGMLLIVLPSLRAARQQAQSVYCLNNLRQMAIAAHQYASLYKDHYPLAYYTVKIRQIRYYYCWDFTTWKDWGQNPAVECVEPGLLWMAHTTEKVQQCPVFKREDTWFADPYTGYNYNTSYIGMNETITPVNSARTTEVASPARTALFGDGEFSSGANKFMRAPFSNPRDASFSDPGRVAGTQGFRHRGKTNVAFCDGHAQPWSTLYNNTDPIGRQTLDAYNACNRIQIGFLSPDNSLYDLK